MTYAHLSAVHSALTLKKVATEKMLSARGLKHFKRSPSELYIVYASGTTGPFSIRDPLTWAEQDKSGLRAILNLATSLTEAQKVYARSFISGEDKDGIRVFKAARVDLELAVRVASALPEDHPALKIRIKHAAPLVFFEDRED